MPEITITPALLRRKDVERRCSVSRDFIYKHMRDGTFPRPVPIAPGAVRWRVEDIEIWIADRAAPADAA